MKKLIALLSIVALTLLASCGKSDVESTEEITTSTGVEVNLEETLEVEEVVMPTTDSTVEEVVTEEVVMPTIDSTVEEVTEEVK